MHQHQRVCLNFQFLKKNSPWVFTDATITEGLVFGNGNKTSFVSYFSDRHEDQYMNALNTAAGAAAILNQGSEVGGEAANAGVQATLEGEETPLLIINSSPRPTVAPASISWENVNSKINSHGNSHPVISQRIRCQCAYNMGPNKPLHEFENLRIVTWTFLRVWRALKNWRVTFKKSFTYTISTSCKCQINYFWQLINVLVV